MRSSATESSRVSLERQLDTSEGMRGERQLKRSAAIECQRPRSHAHAVGVPVVLQAATWLDTNTGGTSHTYRVSAVSVNLAESPFAPTAGVTG